MSDGRLFGRYPTKDDIQRAPGRAGSERVRGRCGEREESLLLRNFPFLDSFDGLCFFNSFIALDVALRLEEDVPGVNPIPRSLLK